MTQKKSDLLKLEEKAIRAFNKVVGGHDFDWDSESNIQLLGEMGRALKGIAAIRAQRVSEEAAEAKTKRPASSLTGSGK